MMHKIPYSPSELFIFVNNWIDFIQCIQYNLYCTGLTAVMLYLLRGKKWKLKTKQKSNLERLG